MGQDGSGWEDGEKWEDTEVSTVPCSLKTSIRKAIYCCYK
jgi:hypothetical protein